MEAEGAVTRCQDETGAMSAGGPIGPVGRDVLLTGRLEMVARPDPVGPPDDWKW